ncbi:sulfurtransferase TusA family protein [Paenibacillus sp. GCM10027627]|uniref:sulfurtransferase TusA family protein n=1 Tax=unclassified Paenibacillus TaxID=185978 RepID=UPI00362F9769
MSNELKRQTSLRVDVSLDCIGLACPMPIVRTKKAMDGMAAGQVIEIQATDKGSLADLQSWSKKAGHDFLGSMEEGGVLRHYVRKLSQSEAGAEPSYAQTVSNKEFAAKLRDGEELVLLDVREAAEFAFGHISGARSLPLGELENRLSELHQEQNLFVICRTGKRSDLACQLLADNGFKNVWNVLPGMASWDGEKEG